jgi:hypothetical protein
MQAKFSELVVSGSFALVKGFLLGFKGGSETDFSYFFHRKSGIRRDTLAELLKEVLDLDNYVHLCLEDRVVPDFKRAVAEAEPLVGIKIKNERPIKEARFDFSFIIKNREAAGKVKQVLAELPEGVELLDYEPVEETHDDKSAIGGYAPEVPYQLKGSGTVRGEFGGVIELFLTAKRMPEGQLVLLSDMVLGFED